MRHRFSRRLRAANSTFSDRILPKFELIQAFYARLVTYKKVKDPAEDMESMYQNGYFCTAALQDSQPNRLYTRLPDVNIKNAIFTAAVPEQIQIYTAAVCPHKIAIYTAAVQEPNRLYTLLPGIYIQLLFTRQPFKSQIGYIHCCQVYIHVHKIVIYTAAIQEPNRLYALLQCV